MNSRITVDPPELARYLATLEAALADAPDGARSEIIADVRAHAADALAEGRVIEQVLSALGPANEHAAQYRDELGLPDVPPPNSRRGRARMHGAAVVIALLTGSLAVFVWPGVVPAGEVAGIIAESGPEDLPVQLQQTLLAQYGPGVILLAFLPALLAFLPLVLPQRIRTPVAIANACVVAILGTITFASVGWIYVPLAVLMWAAVVVPWRVEHGLDLARSSLWRIFGGLLLSAPGFLLIGGMLTGAILTELGGVLMVAVILVLAALFAFGARAAYYLIASVGFAVMVLAMLSPGMLTIAFWWTGGAYLAIGMSAVATLRSGRKAAE